MAALAHLARPAADLRSRLAHQARPAAMAGDTWLAFLPRHIVALVNAGLAAEPAGAGAGRVT